MLSSSLLSSFILQFIIIVTANEIDKAWRILNVSTFDKSNDLLTSNNFHSSIHTDCLLNKELKTHNFLEIPELTQILLNSHHVEKRSPELLETNDSYKKDVATNDMFSNREARGATREQWIKQPYPVDFQSKKGDDNDQRISNSKNDDTNERAPRVHFVTNQKRLDTSESRSRLAEVQRGQSMLTPSPRSTRMYESHQGSPPETSQSTDPFEYRNRHDRRSYHRDYNRYDLDPMKNPTSRYNEYDMNYKSPTQKKQRIIYYATLPEVVRTPPNVNLRYRSPDSHLYVPPYNYHNRGYYNGKVSSSPVSVAEHGFDAYDREGRYDAPPTYIKRPYYRRHPLPPYSFDDDRIPHSSQGVYDIPPLRSPYPRQPPYFPKEHPRFNRLSMADVMPPDEVHKENMMNSRADVNSRSSNEKENHLNFPAPSPVKISTSVNVKEFENPEPERRVYAKQERDYVYENLHHFV